jgi:hypothetical protein
VAKQKASIVGRIGPPHTSHSAIGPNAIAGPRSVRGPMRPPIRAGAASTPAMPKAVPTMTAVDVEFISPVPVSTAVRE